MSDAHLPITLFSLKASITIVLAIITYVVGLVVYRLYFHPLARYPGPKLAAATQLYEAYYNYSPWHKGTYFLKVHELHKKYGPLLRMSPSEISISDPDHFEKIFRVNSPYQKAPAVYNLTRQLSMFTATTKAEDRRRREPLQSFFGRRNVLQMELPIIRPKVDRVLSKIQDAVNEGIDRGEAVAVDLSLLMRCMAFDVVSHIAFDQSSDFIDNPDNGETFIHSMEAFFQEWIMAMYLPGWFPLILRGAAARLYGIGSGKKNEDSEWSHRMAQEKLQQLRNSPREEFEKRRSSNTSIFWHMLDPDMPLANRLSDTELIGEAFGTVGAGGDTVGSALCQSIFGLLDNPDNAKRLVQELQEAFPDPKQEMPYSTLEKLPHLSAVVKEGLRVSCGVFEHMHRVVPAEGAYYKDAFFPPGTQISMSIYGVHNDPAIFPDPTTFSLERWLGPEAKRCEKYLVPFSRGSENCIGQNLALCKMYITIAYIFRRYELRLNGTTKDDMTVKQAFLVAHHGEGQRNLSVFATPRVD